MIRKNLTKIIIHFFLVSFFKLATINLANAEIIDLKKEVKNFGEWTTFCEIDLMMDIHYCKVASKFFENKAVISIEPTAKFYSKFFIVIPQVKIGSFVKIRIDKNDLILSNTVSNKDFGLIMLNSLQKQKLYRQMKRGDFLFLRFSISNSDKEITAKISLKDFRSALNYVKK